MSSSVPQGYVDPLDPQEVAPVLAGALTQLGVAGVLELLARIPGVETAPGQPRRRLRAAVAPSVAVGEDVVRFGDPLTREHVVGGIVLSRTPLPPVELASVLAALCGAGVRASGAVTDASVALTAVRDSLSSSA